MHESGAQVVVSVNMRVTMPVVRVIVSMGVMIIRVMKVMIIPQEKRAKQIDTKTGYRNWNGLVEGNSNGIYETVDTFITNKQGDHRQRYRTRECRKVAELSSTKR
jgi:hypothetical protein